MRTAADIQDLAERAATYLAGYLDARARPGAEAPAFVVVLIEDDEDGDGQVTMRTNVTPAALKWALQAVIEEIQDNPESPADGGTGRPN